ELVDLLAQPSARLVQRRRVAIAQGRLPVAPALLPLLVQRAVERPILDPPRVLLTEFAKGALPLGAAGAEEEPAEGATENASLDAPVVREIDARLASQPGELRLLVGRERIEVSDAVQVDVDGLERERAGG